MRVVLAAGVAFAALGGCADTADESQITVLAAASLKAPFSEIATRFEASEPGTSVRFNFAGSSDLVAQLQQGAPGDVLATADEPTMAMAEGLTGTPTIFASNSMTIAVPIDNPGTVTGLQSLASPALDVVVCAPQVPCGAATTRIEAAAGIDILPDSEEASVTDVLNKVATGQADAGIVYVSDVAAADETVTTVEIPAQVNATNRYPIAVLNDAADPQTAEAFVDFVNGQQGQRILRRAGFGPGR
jgi:molybdate transport system substrate-binding protein